MILRNSFRSRSRECLARVSLAARRSDAIAPGSRASGTLDHRSRRCSPLRRGHQAVHVWQAEATVSDAVGHERQVTVSHCLKRRQIESSVSLGKRTAIRDSAIFS